MLGGRVSCRSSCLPVLPRMRREEQQVRKLAGAAACAGGLDPPGEDDRVELGRVATTRDRGRAGLPPADGARTAAPVQRRGRRRAGRPARGRAASGGSPRPSAAGSSRWPARRRRGGWHRREDGVLDAADEAGPPQWTLDTLTEAARAEGIEVHRSQVRRILLAERVRWRRTRSWATSHDPEFAPKGRRSSRSTPTRREARRSSAPTSSAR